MWEHQTDEKHGWKYSVSANKFIIQITGGSISILDRQTQALLKRYSGHHYLYTGDISPDEKQCFALENGKHFYVYSLENFELIKRVTLPRGYECIDMYGHYTDDGSQICIPAHRYIKANTISGGYYEYVMCQYDAQQLILTEKSIIEDPKPYHWEIDTSLPELDDIEMGSLQKIMDIVSANLENKDFMDHLLGLTSNDDNQAIAEITRIIMEETGQ